MAKKANRKEKEITEEDARKAIAEVKHPAIDRTLVDLGIVKDIKVEEGKVLVTIALPFAGIPAQIRQYLVNSVSAPIKNLGAEIEVELTIMNQDEQQAFLAMEQKSWRGL